MIQSQDPTQNCDCGAFSDPVLAAGCENFKSLGWDNPSVDYEAVECPAELAETPPCWEDNGETWPSSAPALCAAPPTLWASRLLSDAVAPDSASDIIIDHIDGFTWHLVFGIEFSYSLEGLVDEDGVELEVADVVSYNTNSNMSTWQGEEASFIEWTSSSMTFSITDSLDELESQGAWPGLYRTDLTVYGARGGSDSYSFFYDIVSGIDDKLESVLEWEE